MHRSLTSRLPSFIFGSLDLHRSACDCGERTAGRYLRYGAAVRGGPQQCPNWHLPDRHSSPSLWLPFFMSTVPLLVALTFVGIHWRWIVRKAIESVDYPTTVPIPYT